ncbi:hypothetical protein NLI96_g9753 [Meripilus lineatus]|uniref:DUF6533 domain-containing protein n=1 Tax=Meripilus lineatus TaxID=2056292 RepID=A0AAD5YAP0_9APHY|nr:hypothetical protein NLI96_g9753 [Physisporinus lineatus]
MASPQYFNAPTVNISKEEYIRLTYESYPATLMDGALVALPVYTYILTLPMEVSSVWKRENVDLVTLLFLLNRYLPFVWLLMPTVFGGCQYLKWVFYSQTAIILVVAISQAGQ